MIRHAPSIGIGIGLSLRGSGARFSGLLDEFGGAEAAYSLRALSRGWLAGDVIRARRVNTPAEANFTASQILNGELATWALGGDAFVPTWYDQSGNAKNATQATTTMQPKIVSAGALVTGGLEFDGIDDELDTPSLISSVASASSFVMAKSSSASQAGTALSLSRNNPDQRWYAPIMISGNMYFGYGDSATKVNLGVDDLSKHLFTAIADNINATGFLDSISKGSSAVFTGIGILTTGGIGAVNGLSPFNGIIGEIIVYNSDQSTNRAGIEANINAYYSIY